MNIASAKMNRTRSRICGGGFTLVELMLVVVLAGILAAAAIPTMNSLGSSKAAGVQRQIQRDLSFARERAINTGLRTWVVFSVGGNAYSVLSEPAGNPGRLNAAVIRDPATGRDYTVSLGAQASAGVALTSVNIEGGSEVGFDWRGRPVNSAGASLSGAGVVTITGGRTVSVRPGWGLATIP